MGNCVTFGESFFAKIIQDERYSSIKEKLSY